MFEEECGVPWALLRQGEINVTEYSKDKTVILLQETTAGDRSGQSVLGKFNCYLRKILGATWVRFWLFSLKVFGMKTKEGISLPSVPISEQLNWFLQEQYESLGS